MEFYDQWKNVIVFWLLRFLIEKERIAGSYCRAPKGKGTPFTPAPLAGHPPNLARASSGRCPKRLSAQTRASCPGFLELAAVTPPIRGCRPEIAAFPSPFTIARNRAGLRTALSALKTFELGSQSSPCERRDQ